MQLSDAGRAGLLRSDVLADDGRRGVGAGTGNGAGDGRQRARDAARGRDHELKAHCHALLAVIKRSAVVLTLRERVALVVVS